jgi:hypothetical protein
MEPGELPGLKNRLLFMVQFAFTLVGFALALSVFITILFFGFNILINGFHVAVFAVQSGQYNLFLKSPLSCAIVEVILLVISGIGLKYTLPLMVAHYQAYWKLCQQRFNKK